MVNLQNFQKEGGKIYTYLCVVLEFVHTWRKRLAKHYRRVVQFYSMDGMGDWEFKLRDLYTPCTLTDSTDWPPRPAKETYDQYHRLFQLVINDDKGRVATNEHILHKD